MIYGISLLLIVLSVVMCIPAIRRLLKMQDIKTNRATTQGRVLSSNSLLGLQGGRIAVPREHTRSASAWGWWTAELGNQDRPLIQYRSNSGAELLLEVTASSVFYQRRYETGEAVEVTYDSTCPSRAYPTQEWKIASRELWLGSGALIVGIILWVIGRIYSMPF